MALRIRGAPLPGWYLPVGDASMRSSPYLWTGIARMKGGAIEGRVISIQRCRPGPKAVPSWQSDGKIRLFGDPTYYTLVERLPDEWHEQDVRAAAAQAEALADQERLISGPC